MRERRQRRRDEFQEGEAKGGVASDKKSKSGGEASHTKVKSVKEE